MHSNFDASTVDWSSILGNYQIVDELLNANDLQFGSGGQYHYTAFSGSPYQRGAGIGSMFRSLLRFLIPLGKKAGAAIGRQGLESSARVLTSVLDGKDLKQTLVEEGRSGLSNLLDRASQNLGRQQGQAGSGNFDFRRYKKNLQLNKKTGLIDKETGANEDGGTLGVFTQAPKNHINSGEIGRAINNSKLRSIIGPPTIPKQPKKKRHTKKANINDNHKKIRFDSLGPY